MKKYLAFDASSDELIAGCFNGEKYCERREIGGGTEKLLPLIDAVLSDAKMTIGDVDVVCVGVGPGSWTGSRVSVVTAYGLSAGNKKLKFCKFNAFDLISYNGNENKKNVKLVSAFANFVYVQDYNGNISADTKEELISKYKDVNFIAATQVIDGVMVVPKVLKSVADELVQKQSFTDIKDIEPMYLRKSQAEYQRDARLK